MLYSRSPAYKGEHRVFLSDASLPSGMSGPSTPAISEESFDFMPVPIRVLPDRTSANSVDRIEVRAEFPRGEA